jgi:hypothetical protein
MDANGLAVLIIDPHVPRLLGELGLAVLVAKRRASGRADDLAVSEYLDKMAGRYIEEHTGRSWVPPEEAPKSTTPRPTARRIARSSRVSIRHLSGSKDMAVLAVRGWGRIRSPEP